MPGTTAGAAKRARCTCGAYVHDGPCRRPGPAPRSTDALIAAGRVVEPSGCHSFRGGRRRYPTVGNPKVSIVHHLLGLTPGDGLEARHTCDVDWCINPEHLVAGTRQDNVRDAVERGRIPAGPNHWNYRGDSR